MLAKTSGLLTAHVSAAAKCVSGVQPAHLLSTAAQPSRRDERPAIAPRDGGKTAIDRAKEDAFQSIQPDVAPPTIARPPRRPVSPAGHIQPVDAAIAREIRKMETATEVLKHHRENMDDYNVVNLSAALTKVVSNNGKQKPWKMSAVNAKQVDMLANHAVAELRATMKLDREFRRWKAQQTNGLADSSNTAALGSPLQCRTIATTLQNLTKLDRAPKSLLDEVSVSLLDRVGEMTPQDVSQLAYAYSRANAPAPILFNALARHVEGSLDKFNDEELASLLSSYASLKTAAPSLFGRVVDRLCRRREQTKTVTPRILATSVMALAKSLDFDERLPARLRPENLNNISSSVDEGSLTTELDSERAEAAAGLLQANHRTAAIEALETLSSRIESTARKFRVPIPREDLEHTAFTTQGLAMVAWSYARVYKTWAATIKGGGQSTQVATRLVKHASSVAPAEVEAACKTFLEGVLARGPDYGRDGVSGSAARPRCLHDATVIRVLTALSAAFIHPQTLATAQAPHLTIMATSVATVRSTLLERLSGLACVVQDLQALPASAVTDVAIAVAERQMDDMRGLLVQLGTRKAMEAIAQATVRILDPASAGPAVEAKAASGRAELSGQAAVDRAIAADKAAGTLAALEARALESSSGRTGLASSHAGPGGAAARVDELGRALVADEVDEDAREAQRLLQKLDGSGSSNNEDDIVEGSGGAGAGAASAAAGRACTAANVEDGLAALRHMGDRAASGDLGPSPSSAGPAGQAAASSAGPAATGAVDKFNPLAYQQSVALAVPVSMHDVAELAWAFAEVCPLLHVPELWSKLADRVERGAVRPSTASNAASGDNADGSGSGSGSGAAGASSSDLLADVSKRRPASPARSRAGGARGAGARAGVDEDLIRNMPSRDVANMLLSFSVAAPDGHAARVLKSVALVFSAEDAAETPQGLRTALQTALGGGQGADSAVVAGATATNRTGNGSASGLRWESQAEEEAAGSTGSGSASAVATAGPQASAATPASAATTVTVPVGPDGAPLESTATPSFDEEPTWVDDIRESLRRARTFRAAPTTPVHRLRGAPLVGSTVPEYNPAPGEDGSAAAGEGEADLEALRAVEAPNVDVGTKGSWASRVLNRSSAMSLVDIATAYALALPCVSPGPGAADLLNSGSGPSSGATAAALARVDAGAMMVAVTKLFETAVANSSAVGSAAAVNGTDGPQEDQLLQQLSTALRLTRASAGAASAHYSLPTSWHVWGGPLAHLSSAAHPQALCAPEYSLSDPKALLYAKHPVLAGKRWTAGLRPFSPSQSVRDGVAKSTVGSAAPALAAVSDTVALASMCHLLTAVSKRLGLRVKGNEIGVMQTMDLLSLLQNREYGAPQSAHAAVEGLAPGAPVHPVYHRIVHAEAAWLGKHIEHLQKRAKKREDEVTRRKVDKIIVEGLDGPAARGKKAPWLAEAGKGSDSQHGLCMPSPLEGALGVYSGLGLCFGLEAWQGLVDSGFELTPYVMSRQKELQATLLLLLDEASRRLALELKGRRSAENFVQSSLDGSTARQAGVALPRFKSDPAVASMSAMLAAAVLPYAMASVPRYDRLGYTSPQHSELEAQARRVKRLATLFVRAVASGPALGLDPRLGDLHAHQKLVDSGVEGLLGSTNHHASAAAAAANVAPSPRAVLRGAVATVTIAGRSWLDYNDLADAAAQAREPRMQ